ncbi:MAG: DUF2849 domain-containing protein [Alphaproteobacteria bacterium]
MTLFVVTANLLADGGVRWLRAEAGHLAWTSVALDASTTEDAHQRDAWLAAAEADVARNLIVAPYAVEVASHGDGFRHVSVRERVRANGPTVGNSLVAATGRA